MDSVMTTIGIGLFMTLVSPFVASFSARQINNWKKKDAYARLSNDPHIYVGAQCRAIYIDGRESPLVPRCVIRQLEVGRMVVRITEPDHPDYGCEHTFTGREFEALHPRMEPSGIGTQPAIVTPVPSVA